jgi:hypothetical protein
LFPPTAWAYERTFPDQLDAADGDAAHTEGEERERRIRIVLDRQSQRQSLRSGLGRARDPAKTATPSSSSSPPPPSVQTRIAGSGLWASALWLASGSRSNPIATPLANFLYDPQKEDWLQDRNDGLFADLPLPLLGALAVLYAAIGFGADQLVSQLAAAPSERGVAMPPNAAASLQLAGVCLIGSATLELGRVASGEKRPTRTESDRDDLLRHEFEMFADSRLLVGGSGTCHRLDVVRAFRRFYGKYRQPDNPQFPLGDLEIEQLLRNWSRQFSGVEMSSAGFYSGVKVNADADAFAA